MSVDYLSINAYEGLGKRDNPRSLGSETSPNKVRKITGFMGPRLFSEGFLSLGQTLRRSKARAHKYIIFCRHFSK